MKRTKFYICEKCLNVVTSLENNDVLCCGEKLLCQSSNIADTAHKLNVEKVENDYYITFEHPMEKEHFISFVAYVRFDRVLLIKLYPEQGGEVRFPIMRGGKIYYYCTNHGLFELKI